MSIMYESPLCLCKHGEYNKSTYNKYHFCLIMRSDINIIKSTCIIKVSLKFEVCFLADIYYYDYGLIYGFLSQTGAVDKVGFQTGTLL